MRESGDEKSTLRQIEKIKALSEDMLEYQAIDVHKAWQSMERRAKRKASMRMFSLFFTRAAAILVVPLLISSLFFSYLYYTTGRNVKTGASVVFAEISSMPGTITRLVLPDQSVVWLNAGSRLVYPSVFDEKERKVQLFGEGYFEVEADSEHPFSVSTSEGLRVIAYGTKFNVNAYDTEEYFVASLVEGAVSVSCVHNRNSSYALQPRQQIVVSDHSSKVSSFENTDFMAWKEGVFIFDDMLLTDIIKKLELYYDVSIIVKNTKLGNFRYTGKFRQRDGVESVLRKLQIVYPFKYTKDDDRNLIVLQ